ncbi:hypothetical protein SCHPADRAFT_456567 [Schizopora paradoxa]|uniref:Uncharacterized protein n=1 Tax=Schizopora paradoxa TaxID=27342 RepID=A0A0H2RID1_9AGAM|nr:hypothetical protein SCHPADRAFT_456567 [Schizopora paradoxa]
MSSLQCVITGLRYRYKLRRRGEIHLEVPIIGGEMPLYHVSILRFRRNVFLPPTLTPKGCHDNFVPIPWLLAVGVVSSEAILITRTFAIYGRSYIILAYLVCMRIATVIPSLKLCNEWNKGMKYLDSPFPTLAPCLPKPNKNVKLWLDFLFIAIFDCHIVGLTLFKAYQQWRYGLTKHRLITTIYRDGIGYFIVLFMVSTTNVTFLNTERNNLYFDFFILFQRIMYAILASRIVINVRKAASPAVDVDIDTSGEDPISFGRRGTTGTGGSLSALAVATVSHKHVETGFEMDWSPDGKIHHENRYS